MPVKLYLLCYLLADLSVAFALAVGFRPSAVRSEGKRAASPCLGEVPDCFSPLPLKDSLHRCL